MVNIVPSLYRLQMASLVELTLSSYQDSAQVPLPNTGLQEAYWLLPENPVALHFLILVNQQGSRGSIQQSWSSSPSNSYLDVAKGRRSFL